jgi:alpha-galactosidase
VIAVDQDLLGSEGKRVRKNGDLEVWVKQMKDGSRAVVLFNRGITEHEVTVNWEDLGYPDHLNAAVRDLWLKQDVGRFTGKLTASVPSHAVVMVTVKP